MTSVKPDKTAKGVALGKDPGGRGSTRERSDLKRWCGKDRHSNSRVAVLTANGCGHTATGPADAIQSGSSAAGSPRSRTRGARSSADWSGFDGSGESAAG